MACTSITTITKSCDNNSGGLLRAWVVDQDNLTGTTVNTTDWEVTALTNDVAFTEIEFKRNVASYVPERQNDFANGSNFYKTTLNFVFHRRDAAKSRALKILGEGQRYLAFVVEDTNGLYWLLENMQMTTDTGGSGTARADGSKYEVAFEGENEFSPYTVDSTIIPNLTQVNS
jgi:hypothetical protein